MLIKSKDIDNDGDLDILLGSNSAFSLEKEKVQSMKIGRKTVG